MSAHRKWLLLCIVISISMVFAGCSKSNTSQKQNNQNVPKQVKINQQAIDIQKPHPKEFLQLNPPTRQPQTITLYSASVSQAPKIDGKSVDPVWNQSKAITTLDYVSGRPITLKSVHTKDMIYFLAQFSDVSPSMTQKSLGWDYEDQIYKQLNDREDVFVLKWSISGNGIDLSYRHPMPYQADVWFWKANRTDPMGYADDKIQILQKTPNKKFKKIPVPDKANQYMYLERKGDEGSSAYKSRLLFEYEGDVIPQFVPVEPTGSRADIRAKGFWKDGFWTVEFARKLKTGYGDDVQFEKGKEYLFGVATSELAFDPVHPEFSVPLYRSGDIFDRLLMQIQ